MDNHAYMCEISQHGGSPGASETIFSSAHRPLQMFSFPHSGRVSSSLSGRPPAEPLAKAAYGLLLLEQSPAF